MTCSAKLSVAEPGLKAAEEALKKIKKEDFIEMKSFKTPPVSFGVIFQGVLMMFGFFPKRNEKPAEYYVSQAKKQLDNPAKFLDKLKTIDKYNIPDKNIKSLNEFLSKTPNYNETEAKKCTEA